MSDTEMAVQVPLLNIDISEGSSKITIFYVFAFALTFRLFRHLARTYSEYKVCRLFEGHGTEFTNRSSRQILLLGIVTAANYPRSFLRDGSLELIGSRNCGSLMLTADS
jgi:hypothetical protein